MRIRVVHVDDLAEVRQIVRLILEQSGWFEVVGEAGDGVQGLEVVRAARPDVVLLDVEMPGPSGWTVLPRIREELPDTKVVILSGTEPDRGQVDPETRALAAAVLEKGVPSSLLIETLLSVAPRQDEPPAATVETVDRPAPGPDDVAARLVALVESSPDAIIGQTTGGRVVSWNPGASRIYGYTAEEMIGRPITVIVPPDSPENLGRVHQKLLSGEAVEEFEAVRRRKDGSLVEVAITVSPVRDASGAVVGLWSVAHDISARRQADAALARAVAQLERQNRELRRSNEELDSFASVASHDLAQPLQVAYGYLEMLRDDYAGSLDQTAATWLEASVRSLDRMRHLVQDILEYARTGSRETIPEPIPLDDALAIAVDGLHAVIADRDVRLESSPLPTVSGNRAQLAQLLQNLVSNAVKFVPAERTPVVRVDAARTDEGWELVVADNGRGVPPEERDRIFDMFHRAPGVDVAGTGLGLAICKKLVHRHGGRIWVDQDDELGGAAFHVVLPPLAAVQSGSA